MFLFAQRSRYASCWWVEDLLQACPAILESPPCSWGSAGRRNKPFSNGTYWCAILEGLDYLCNLCGFQVSPHATSSNADPLLFWGFSHSYHSVVNFYLHQSNWNSLKPPCCLTDQINNPQVELTWYYTLIKTVPFIFSPRSQHIWYKSKKQQHALFNTMINFFPRSHLKCN